MIEVGNDTIQERRISLLCNQTTRVNTNCPFCESNQKDEIHFLFDCSKYSLIKNNFYNKVKTLIPNITQLPMNVLMNELMNTYYYYFNIQFMKYISACFDSFLRRIINKVA